MQRKLRNELCKYTSPNAHLVLQSDARGGMAALLGARSKEDALA
jgi:hypothetical protein